VEASPASSTASFKKFSKQDMESGIGILTPTTLEEDEGSE
jgi:hypothetical protein